MVERNSCGKTFVYIATHGWMTVFSSTKENPMRPQRIPPLCCGFHYYSFSLVTPAFLILELMAPPVRLSYLTSFHSSGRDKNVDLLQLHSSIITKIVQSCWKAARTQQQAMARAHASAHKNPQGVIGGRARLPEAHPADGDAEVALTSWNGVARSSTAEMKEHLDPSKNGSIVYGLDVKIEEKPTTDMDECMPCSKNRSFLFLSSFFSCTI